LTTPRGRSEGGSVRGRRVIEPIAFAPQRALPFEVLTLRSLHARRPRDLTRPERPDFHIVFLATHGRGSHVVDFVRHPLRRGQLLTVAAGRVQQFASPSSFDALMLVVRPDAVKWRPELDGRVVTPTPQRLRLVTTLFEQLGAELGPDGGGSAELAARLVEAIGVACASAASSERTPRDLVGRFRRELEKHHRRSHEVAAYAAILRCTTRTLTRHCVTATGRTAKQIIDERVALEARRSLAHEDVTVVTLARTLGFASSTQFVKFFRRVTGETPTAFRARFVPR
jgi:AraC-like DNA-binding protein